MALRTILVVFLLCLLVSPIGLADEVYDLSAKLYDPGVRPGPRMDFSWAYRYHPHGENSNLYVNGGVDGQGDPMDLDGTVWKAILHLEGANWIKLEPSEWSQIAPYRHGHSGGIFVTESPMVNIPENLFTTRNYVTFGGYDWDAIDYTDETWIFAESVIKMREGKTTVREWIKATNVGDTPDARKYAVMVYLPDAGSGMNHKFFLLGGIDDSSLFRDAFIGACDRRTQTPTATPSATPTSQGVPTSTPTVFQGIWDTGIEFEMDWEELDTPPSEIGLEGAAAVYDPYYGEYRRILVYGGINSNNALSSAVFEYKLEGTPGWMPTWTPAPSWTPAPTCTPVPTAGQGTPAYTATPTMTPRTTPLPRCYHAMALDIREHRLLVHGGNPTPVNPVSDDVLGDLWEYDLINHIWTPLTTTASAARWKHAGAYYWFTLFGGQDKDGLLYDDILEYKPEESGKVWDIEVGSDYGLDDPEKVINTQRVKSNDLVRIHQTQSSWPGDVFDVQLYIPWFVKNLTVEGVNNDTLRAGLWGVYEATPVPIPLPMTMDMHTKEGLDDFKEGFIKGKSCVIYDGAGTTFKNLIIGHHLPSATPVADLPQTILDSYELIANATPLKIYNIHMLDPGIIMTGPTRVDNCEFIANGVGCVMICVSSTIKTDRVYNSIFQNNFTGILELETTHRVYNNVFSGNKLCGIEFDKGAHGMVYNNLFFENGDGDCDAPEEWLSGIISGYSITGNVPAVQQPFIFNNTFVDNYAALTVWEDGDIRQYVNSPCFFNNIMYTTEYGDEPAIKQETGTLRNRPITFHNCMYGYDTFFSEESMKLLSSWSFSEDPDFASSPEYRLSNSSPCLNEGFHHLALGATDMNDTQDAGMVDTGYHFTDTEPVFGPPENLEEDDGVLTWAAPTGSTPYDYVVYWEDAYGILIDLQYVNDTEFEVVEANRNQGYWFGVCGRTNDNQYGESAFIEL